MCHNKPSLSPLPWQHAVKSNCSVSNNYYKISDTQTCELVAHCLQKSGKQTGLGTLWDLPENLSKRPKNQLHCSHGLFSPCTMYSVDHQSNHVPNHFLGLEKKSQMIKFNNVSECLRSFLLHLDAVECSQFFQEPVRRLTERSWEVVGHYQWYLVWFLTKARNQTKYHW